MHFDLMAGLKLAAMATILTGSHTETFIQRTQNVTLVPARSVKSSDNRVQTVCPLADKIHKRVLTPIATCPQRQTSGHAAGRPA